MRSIVLSALAAGFAQAYTVTNVGLFMFKNIDPLVVPGKYTSHMHSFFGSDAITANTKTSEELQKGCSTAKNPNDYSTYWVPTLYHVDGSNYTAVPIFRFSAYYVDVNSAEIAIPQNMKLLAGNATATSQDGVDGNAGIQWFCDSQAGEEKDDAAFPTETCKYHLQTLLLFPDCANPDTLEYAYSANPDWVDGYGKNRCPIGMKRIPRLRFSIRYDLRNILPDGWSGSPPLELACGSSYCSHGDFINGWLPEAADNMVKDASSNDREYFQVSGPNGAGDEGSLCDAEDAQDSDPTHGTSDYWESVMMVNPGISTLLFFWSTYSSEDGESLAIAPSE
ncbi:hypothetical protein F9C07_2200262 [Aspergillus flavus]|uniref:DUF1996 domain-containing protein n=4 Tax=Aspergillus subgen. Circumdati TaxID=2720871 RepID=A0A7U2MSI8_ASPFN|nr:unnamed protein product [Aspergillus oryzae RIB40]EIT72785.1 hypothetical protein Ao3042_00970 [Aspergillus oryzae 3.042]KAB8248228.1 hypothetical protein BDV35DRAFT_379083 [Aspergillus flavus]KDE83859.1 hypothetical protein AO1008_10433 [Aspergillus oryzae 100-8]QRD89058.1 hypothetical protein F9C07_2200262 [Aspergillus flavus]BAE54784.1 unnamed protein product [Aspergillus oryzae RIB40]|eukprot:EIT72785.1 hypothetical protein Ao3042_00970 [Aspergillus oryzae 3.042]